MDGNWDGHDHLQRIATMAQARWIGSWANDDRVAAGAEDAYLTAAAADRIGLIAYQGMRDYSCERAVAEPELAWAYAARTEALVSGLLASGARVWFIVEPGLVADLGSCAGDPRGAWLAEAVGIIADAGGTVYIDAGTDGALAGTRLAGVDLSRVAGFAIGTGAHVPDAEATAEGAALLQTLADAGVEISTPRALDPGQPGLGFIIDTSRNGAPVTDLEPCNPEGAALGKAPRLVDDGTPLDAYVWIKRPGESDGHCNGGPDVGQFHVGLALALARAADPSAA